MSVLLPFAEMHKERLMSDTQTLKHCNDAMLGLLNECEAAIFAVLNNKANPQYPALLKEAFNSLLIIARGKVTTQQYEDMCIKMKTMYDIAGQDHLNDHGPLNTQQQAAIESLRGRSRRIHALITTLMLFLEEAEIAFEVSGNEDVALESSEVIPLDEPQSSQVIELEDREPSTGSPHIIPITSAKRPSSSGSIQKKG